MPQRFSNVFRRYEKWNIGWNGFNLLGKNIWITNIIWFIHILSVPLFWCMVFTNDFGGRNKLGSLFLEITVHMRQFAYAKLRTCLILCISKSFFLHSGDFIPTCCANKTECQWTQTLSNLICHKQVLTSNLWVGKDSINAGDYDLTN